MKDSLIKLFLILFSFSFVACGTSNQMVIHVQTAEFANDGRPFYMVVRAIDQKAYITETYQEVAEKVFNDTEKSILLTETIYPGKEKQVLIDKQDKIPLAFYFLFTEPSERWKHFLPQPLPQSMKFEIIGNGIKQEP